MNTNRNILILIIFSLTLLLAFIGLWLNSEYHKEKQNLQKEANQIFSNTIRSIEDSIIHQMIYPSIVFKKEDSLANSIITLNNSSVVDTTKILQIDAHSEKKIKRIRKDSSFTFTIRSRFENNLQEDMVGSLSLFIAMGKGDTINNFPEVNNPSTIDLTKELEGRIQKTIQEQGLPLRFSIVQQTDSIDLANQVRSKEYRDIWSGQQYALQLENFRWYLWKNILPQMAFSLALFLIISLAFYFIYKTLQKEQRLTQLKNEFISNVTHELKTPIATVSVAIEALSDFDALSNPSRTKEYLDISKHELNRLSILVDKVLKMSIFENQGLNLKLETLDLKTLTGEIVKSMQLQFEKNNAQTSIHQRGYSFQMKGDRTHLTNVIYNLLDNALKYRNGNPEIQIDLAEKEQSIELAIEDNGIGIPPEYKEKIFDKFFRVPSGDLHNIKGHGLGLSYVHSVISKHGGTIAVDSTLGKGTVFKISLPKSRTSE